MAVFSLCPYATTETLSLLSLLSPCTKAPFSWPHHLPQVLPPPSPHWGLELQFLDPGRHTAIQLDGWLESPAWNVLHQPLGRGLVWPLAGDANHCFPPSNMVTQGLDLACICRPYLTVWGRVKQHCGTMKGHMENHPPSDLPQGCCVTAGSFEAKKPHLTGLARGHLEVSDEKESMHRESVLF